LIVVTLVAGDEHFFVKVGENTPRDKAKISKAQREIDD